MGKLKLRSGIPGRISKVHRWLEEDNLIRIQGWARDGLTHAQIAKNMGVGESTLKEWARKHTPIATALRQSADVADRIVENALFKKAQEGDVTAIKYWLSNRKRKVWKERQEVEVTGDASLAAALEKALKRAERD